MSLIFSKSWHGARIPCEVVCDRAGFSGKIFFCPQNWENGSKWVKNRVFEFIGKSDHWFLLNLVYNENLYYLLCSCTNSVLGNILVPEIWAKMFSANQTAQFFNQSYLQKKSMKWPDFLHVNTNSLKLKVDQKKFWVGMGKNGCG